MREGGTIPKSPKKKNKNGTRTAAPTRTTTASGKMKRINNYGNEKKDDSQTGGKGHKPLKRKSGQTPSSLPVSSLPGDSSLLRRAEPGRRGDHLWSKKKTEADTDATVRRVTSKDLKIPPTRTQLEGEARRRVTEA